MSYFLRYGTGPYAPYFFLLSALNVVSIASSVFFCGIMPTPYFVFF